MPKRKRTRIARKSQAGGGSKNHPKSATGDPFTRLPLDVVYEILGLLTPLELLRLARTNKALRSYLMSKRSLIAWKAARAAATPPVPICPTDMSEPQLAVLLFTRECTTPSYDYYLVEDVQKMAEVVEHYQLRLEARVTESQQELEQLLEAAKSNALERAGSVKVLIEWWRIRETALREREAGLEKARKQHLGEDKTQSGAAGGGAAQRYSTFKSSYNETLKSLMPSANVLMRTYGSIKDAIEADGTDTSSQIFDDAFSGLPTYLDQWREERKSELRRIILEARDETEMEADLDTAEEQDVLYLATSVVATCGNSHCRHDNGTVHWADSIGEHFPKKAFHTQKRNSAISHEEMQCIQVVSDWVEHTKLIVLAVGLDPNTATAEDMDNLDARFYCDGCSVAKFRVQKVAQHSIFNAR
ncbi:hypothetical protein FRC00_011612 [Tulasnella sp. 408]|nr:hypothetical protein FRC00_011612 [Tulasnella sp. 408]